MEGYVKKTGSQPRALRSAPCTSGPGDWSAVTGLGMQLQPKCADDFKDGVEAWATITGKRLVKTLARQSGITRDL